MSGEPLIEGSGEIPIFESQSPGDRSKRGGLIGADVLVDLIINKNKIKNKNKKFIDNMNKEQNTLEKNNQEEIKKYEEFRRKILKQTKILEKEYVKSEQILAKNLRQKIGKIYELKKIKFI